MSKRKRCELTDQSLSFLEILKELGNSRLVIAAIPGGLKQVYLEFLYEM